MRRIKLLILFALVSLVWLAGSRAQQPEYGKMRKDAEKLYAEGSYQLAYELYQKAKETNLPPEEARWVEFRLADTLWRATAGSQTADSTNYDKAREALEAIVRAPKRDEERDRVWAEAQESLGDFYWTRRDQRNWSAGWQYYQPALDWWAGQADIELARQRYLKIVFTIARPPQVEPYYYYGYYGNVLPVNILDNALKIAVKEGDRAHVHYLIAMTLRYYGGDYDTLMRVPESFEAAIKAGKSTQWYDDALYYYGEWMANQGPTQVLEDGSYRREPDYVKALALFRRITGEFQKGETRYYDQARSYIESITRPTLGLGVSSFFLPGAEPEYYLSWRNIKKIELTLYRADLSRDVRFVDRNEGVHNWLQKLAVTEKLKSWSHDTGDKGEHRPGQKQLQIEEQLAPGAYVLEASAGNERARELILITDSSVVLKAANNRALVYFCDALTGAPLAGASVRLWQHYYDGSNYNWREAVKTTDKDGLAVFEMNESRAQSEYFAAAGLGERQAYSITQNYSYNYNYNNNQNWRIYAFTDRPAYRPGDTVQWKTLARIVQDAAYRTPAQQTIKYVINDPRGAKVEEKTVQLNNFGSAWGTLALTESMPLGEYQIYFSNDQGAIGNAVLFRLEEYKLPEFKVSVETPEENGKKKAFRLGEKVEVVVRADYYFGGAVANAKVELVVYQNPFYHYWRPAREYPWFYTNEEQRYYYGGGQIIKREALKTDAAGKATFTFETPRNSGQDFEYRIEARVTDASRREIVSSGNVRVTRQRYYIYPRAEHNLYRPKDTVKFQIKALDANNQPIQVEGNAKITRDYWYEIWLDPQGREVKGEELRRLREKLKVFPPQPQPGEKAWRLKFRGYEHDEIVTKPVKTDAQGEAEVSFTPEREGFYRLAWTSLERGSAPIKAETVAWVVTNATTELGYRHGQLQLVVDKDTFRAGQTAQVMLHSPVEDRYVLFSVEGENFYNYRLVHVKGTVQVLDLPVEDRYVPNIYLAASMVSDRQIYGDTKEVIVPPVKNYLNIEVKADRAQYQPREEGTLSVTARDHEGKPVAAEVALGLVDESVYYIQQDYAGDPRQYYFGTKRQLAVTTASTFQQKRFSAGTKGDKAGGKAGKDGRVDGSPQLEETIQSADAVEDNRAVLAKSAPAPAAPAAQAASGARMRAEKKELAAASERDAEAAEPPPPPPPPPGEPKPGDNEPPVQVRSDFRATALWLPDVVTDREGRATVKVKYPDTLTTWKATARALTTGSQFGIADAATRTKQPLIVRLQAPRFFLVNDMVAVSAVINNNTDQPMTVTPSLVAEGVTIAGLYADGKPVKGEAGPVKVAPNSEARVDWAVTVQRAGTAKLKCTARGGDYADAMEKSYVVFEHGLEKFVAKAGKMRGNEVTVMLNVPKERKPESTFLSVQVAPSMAVTMLDALPYLIDYPYGCTEQTMSRFLPAAITAKTLRDLGVKPEIVMNRVFGGIEPQFANKTQPKGKKDLGQLNDMIDKGLQRLYDFQHSDGGWGWWKEGESDHFMTAYVVWGMTLALKSGVDVRADALARGVSFLDKELVEEEANYDNQAWMLHALAHHQNHIKQNATRFQAKAFDNLWNNRDRLNAYTRALLTLSAHYFGYNDKAATLVRNLENGAKIDKAPDTSIIERGAGTSAETTMATAHWGEDGIYYRWSDGGVEATAFVLRALLAVDARHKLIEPVTNWLVKNRRGAQWSNTRDSAIAVLTLNDYLRRSTEVELAGELEYELTVNGSPVASKRMTIDEALGAPSIFPVDRKLVKDGANEIRIRRKAGQGPIYFSAQAQFFSLEEPITPAGNEIFVRRDYYRLVGRPTLLKGLVYERVPLKDGEMVASGDRVETIITIESKNNLEYLVFEDLKPAGLEAVQIRSGEALFTKELKSGATERKFAEGAATVNGNIERTDYTGRTRWVYQELRDRKVALFIDKLPQGVWEIRYDLRAEAPGKFHALPVVGHAMYVPEIRCNGTETRINVEDAK